MDWEGLGIGFAFYLMIEGIMPFFSPRSWKKAIMDVMHLSENTIRIVGAISIVLGVALLYAFK